MLSHGNNFLVGESYGPPGTDQPGMLGCFQLDFYLGKLFGIAFGYRSPS